MRRVSLGGSVVLRKQQSSFDKNPAQRLVFVQPAVPSHGLSQLHHQGRSSGQQLLSLSSIQLCFSNKYTIIYHWGWGRYWSHVWEHFSISQATFLPTVYEENFLWKNLLISVLAVCIIFHNMGEKCDKQMSELYLTVTVCLCSALSPVHRSAFPASLAGDPFWRKDDEKWSALQVMIAFITLITGTSGLFILRFIVLIKVEKFVRLLELPRSLNKMWSQPFYCSKNI